MIPGAGILLRTAGGYVARELLESQVDTIKDRVIKPERRDAKFDQLLDEVEQTARQAIVYYDELIGKVGESGEAEQALGVLNKYLGDILEWDTLGYQTESDQLEGFKRDQDEIEEKAKLIYKLWRAAGLDEDGGETPDDEQPDHY